MLEFTDSENSTEKNCKMQVPLATGSSILKRKKEKKKREKEKKKTKLGSASRSRYYKQTFHGLIVSKMLLQTIQFSMFLHGVICQHAIELHFY